MDKKQTSTSLEGLFDDEEEETFERLQCPPPIETIKIEKQALEKIFIMAQEMKSVKSRNLEVYSLVIGSGETITDIIIPPQKVSYTHIEISEQDIIKLSEDLKDQGIEVQFLGWAHSHCDFGVFFSGTDDQNQETIFDETTNYKVVPYLEKGIQVKYSYGITVNIHRDTYGVITTQMPCGAILQTKDAEFEVIGELPDDWDEELVRKVIQYELKGKVKLAYRGRKKYSYGKTKLEDYTYVSTTEYPEEYSEEDWKVKEDEEVEDYKESDSSDSIPIEEDELALEKIDTFLKWKSLEIEDPEELERMKKLLMDFGTHLNETNEFYP